MNLFAIAVCLMVLPMVLQLSMGSLAMLERIKLNFDLICIISLCLQIVLIIVGLMLASGYESRHPMPQFLIFFWGLALVFALIFVMVIQLIIRRVLNRKQRN